MVSSVEKNPQSLGSAGHLNAFRSILQTLEGIPLSVEASPIRWVEQELLETLEEIA